jgi:hypothetical protein
MPLQRVFFFVIVPGRLSTTLRSGRYSSIYGRLARKVARGGDSRVMSASLVESRGSLLPGGARFTHSGGSANMPANGAGPFSHGSG